MQDPTCQALIKIDQTAAGIQTVNARELHAFLEVGKDFSTWIKDRIHLFQFEENTDFVCSPILVSEGRGGHNRIDYHLTIDMAKELSMVERTEKGKQARQYFIACERRAKSLAASEEDPAMQMARGLIAATALLEDRKRLIEAQQQQIEHLQPKADFYDAVTESSDAVDIGTVAKVLNLGIGRTRLFEFLRDEGILMHNNRPYQRHIDDGHFRVIETTFDKPDGTTHIYFKTVAFQKGVDFIRKRYLARKERAA